MGAVFVSYRRGDSEGQARALSLELGRLVGKQSVFMDVDSIALGRDFRQVLQERLGSCDLMMVLIGPGWLDAKDVSGNRRLDTAADFVRQEVAAALKRNIPVVPVFVQGAQVPPPEQLPDDLKDLSYRHGFELGHSTWESDIREMVTRLGLLVPGSEAAATHSRVGNDFPARAPHEARRVTLRRIPLAAVVAVVVALSGLLAYRYATRMPGDPAAPVTSPETAANVAPASPGAVAASSSAGPKTTPLPAPASPSNGGGLAGSGLEFAWPGGDCWNIFRGEQLVTYQCGTAKQALAPGTYTIRGRGYAVFVPFDVLIKAGTATRLAKGGVFTFDWPGGDCWDIFRGPELVTYQCGAASQALGAGQYTIKGRGYAVFSPFNVEVTEGSSTRVAKGGVFHFNWPGPDCWDIFQDTALIIYQCGNARQALGAGSYTVKGRGAAVFEPFAITIRDGVTVKKP